MAGLPHQNQSQHTRTVYVSSSPACAAVSHSPQMALKVSDLGHLASPWAVHKRWVQLLEEVGTSGGRGRF